MLLLMGRLLGLPVAVAIVAGHSMEPTLHYGDLIVLVKTGPRELRVGDIVLWCRGPTSCVVHRLVAVHGATAITKGDANPAPDPPVPLDAIRYRVVARIPREAYVAPLVLGVALWAARAASSMGGAAAAARALGRAVGAAGVYDAAWLTLVAYGVALLLAPMYAPYPAHYYTVLQDLRPTVTLHALAVNPDGSLAAVYTVNNTAFLGAENCLVATIKPAGLLGYCNATVAPGEGEGSWVLLVRVPVEFYREAYRLGATRFRANVTVRLSPGTLFTSLVYTLAWKPLQARLDRMECSVKLYNPNPAPVQARVSVRYADTLPGGRRLLGWRNASTLVAPFSTVALPVGPHWDVAVYIAYRGPGGVERLETLYGSCGGRRS